MEAGSNLRSVAMTRKTTQAFGLEIEPFVISEMAKHNIAGLEEAMRTFTVNDVLTLLKDDVNLLIAVGVLEHTKLAGYTLDTAQISVLAKKITDLDDFASSLVELSLPESEILLEKRLQFQNFQVVKSALIDHKLKAGFSMVVELAEVLLKTEEYKQLGPALARYSIEQIKEIISNGISLENQLSVAEALDKENVVVDFYEQMTLTKYSGVWNCGVHVSDTVNMFGIENALKIAHRGVFLQKVIQAKRYLTVGNESGVQLSRESRSIRKQLDEAGIDVLIEVVRAGDVQTAEKVIESGFELEEIIRFPFLISPLIET